MKERAGAHLMQRALDLAAQGRGRTSPNPMVGAVIVKSDRIVGEGYHKRAGSDHAEIVALKAAGRKASGGTLYVTLEPCCHVGRTGPCVDAIAKAGISKVVFAMRDPDPRVDGKGAAALRKAGVKVEDRLLEEQAKRLNEAHVCFHTKHRPFVTLKLAQSLDGRIATRSGDSQWVSGEEARKFVHALRAESDGVLVGMGTVRLDNPALTVRLVRGKNPYRIVASNSLKFPRPCHLLEDNSDSRTIIASSRTAIDRFVRSNRNGNLIFWEVGSSREHYIEPEKLTAQAWQFGLRSLLIEGGSHMATSFLKAGLVDRLILVTAPIVIGDGISAIGDLKISKLAGALRFERHINFMCGTDQIFVGYLKDRR